MENRTSEGPSVESKVELIQIPIDIVLADMVMYPPNPVLEIHNMDM